MNASLLLPKNNTPQPHEVIACVCDVYHLTTEQLMSRNRRQPIAFARQLAMSLVYHFCRTSLHMTGVIFERHHASIVHARKMVMKASHDHEVAKVIQECMERVRAIDTTPNKI